MVKKLPHEYESWCMTPAGTLACTTAELSVWHQARTYRTRESAVMVVDATAVMISTHRSVLSHSAAIRAA